MLIMIQCRVLRRIEIVVRYVRLALTVLLEYGMLEQVDVSKQCPILKAFPCKYFVTIGGRSDYIFIFSLSSQVRYCAGVNSETLLVSSLNSVHSIWDVAQHREFPDADRNLGVPCMRNFSGHTNLRYSMDAVIPSNFSEQHPNILVSGSETGEVRLVRVLFVMQQLISFCRCVFGTSIVLC